MSNLYMLTTTTQITDHDVPARTQAARLTMTVVPNSGFTDGGVFVFIRVSDNTEEFSHIASPNDLVEIPLNGPLDGSLYLRRDQLDLVFNTKSEAIGVCQQIGIDLQLLCDELEKLSTDLGTPTTVTIASRG